MKPLELSKFFNSAAGDTRTYQASDFAEYFGDVLSTGLLHTDETPALEVHVGSGLTTVVSPGKALMQGYGYQNTSDLVLEHSLPETDLDRIDRIVLRLDKRNQSRFIKVFVIQGEPSTDPIAPELTRDEFIYELSLAQVVVRANTSSLVSADLIDERLHEDLCGLVYSLISIPTSQFEAEWDEWFNAQQTEGFVLQTEKGQTGGVAKQDDFVAHQAEKVTDVEGAHGLIYEDGNWSPTLVGATTLGTYTAIGKYTRIGNRCICEFDINWTAKPTGSAGVAITGLPFTRATNQVDHVTIDTYRCGSNSNLGLFSGNSYISVRTIDATGSLSFMVYSFISDNGRIIGKVSYLI